MTTGDHRPHRLGQVFVMWLSIYPALALALWLFEPENGTMIPSACSAISSMSMRKESITHVVESDVDVEPESATVDDDRIAAWEKVYDGHLSVRCRRSGRRAVLQSHP